MAIAAPNDILLVDLALALAVISISVQFVEIRMVCRFLGFLPLDVTLGWFDGKRWLFSGLWIFQHQ